VMTQKSFDRHSLFGELKKVALQSFQWPVGNPQAFSLEHNLREWRLFIFWFGR
jgi:hypothetical protein